MITIFSMSLLKAWLDENGFEGRQKLLRAIRTINPRFGKANLTLYAQGKRIPEIETARIIAKIIGVSLESVPYRYVHKPVSAETEAHHG